MEWWCKK